MSTIFNYWRGIRVEIAQMTTTELHKILDDENRKLTLAELKQVVYELKKDCFEEICKLEPQSWEYRFYIGEQNAFQIVLDLLEHLDDCIKLPHLLCTSSKFACVIWRDKDGKVNKTYTMPIDEARAFLTSKEKDK